MKLVTAIIRDTDNEAISQALTSAGFGVTCIASTGGFLRHGQKNAFDRSGRSPGPKRIGNHS